MRMVLKNKCKNVAVSMWRKNMLVLSTSRSLNTLAASFHDNRILKSPTLVSLDFPDVWTCSTANSNQPTTVPKLGLALASSLWLAVNVFSVNLIDYPAQTLRLVMLIEVPVVILIYSFFRKDMKQSSYSKAVARGLLALPVGAIVNALGAIALGAPVGTQYFLRTLNWSLLMSAFTVVPAASVYGSSWTDWHRIFAQTKLIGSIDYMICLPAHGAVIGAWFGAWPMPLDWERMWQEWPICVTYGAIIGYLVGMLASFGFVVFNASHQRMKGD